MKCLKENVIEVSSRTPSKGETTIKVITVEKVEKAVLEFEKYLDDIVYDDDYIDFVKEKYKEIFGDWEK